MCAAWGLYIAPEETVSGVITWANEICNYDWKNPGFTAGHYTQIVSSVRSGGGGARGPTGFREGAASHVHIGVATLFSVPF